MNNKYPQIHLIYNRHKRATPYRKAAVEIRITHNYKQKFITTGIMLYPNQWKNGKIVNCDNIPLISQTLDKILTDIKQVILEMAQEGPIDILAISDRLDKKCQPISSFIDFCNQRAAIRKFGKKADTQERYDRFIRLFKAWGGIRSFEDINDRNIISYDKYLQSTGMKPTGSMPPSLHG